MNRPMGIWSLGRLAYRFAYLYGTCSITSHFNVVSWSSVAHHTAPGTVSIYDKKSYRKISSEVSKPRDLYLELSALKFDRHFGSIAADVPVKFRSDTTI